MELFRIGKLSAEGIVTHRFPLREIHKALDTYIHRRDGAIKVVLEPQA